MHNSVGVGDGKGAESDASTCSEPQGLVQGQKCERVFADDWIAPFCALSLDEAAGKVRSTAEEHPNQKHPKAHAPYVKWKRALTTAVHLNTL